MTLPKYVPPTYNPPAYNPPAPKPVTPPAGYIIDGNGNLQLMNGYYKDNSGNAEPIPPVFNPPQPGPVTPPAGYTIDGNGNLQLLPGYYTPDNSGNAQPIPINPPQPVSPMPFDPISDVPSVAPQEVDPKYQPPASPTPPTYDFNLPQPGPVYSQDDIRAFVNANISDPAKIQQAMAQYGVDTNQIAQAMGVDPDTVTSYFNNYNQGPSQTAQPPVDTSTPQPNPAPQATSDNTGGVVPYQLPDGSTIMIPAGTLGAEPTPQ